MASYLLLRSNNQTGPHTLEDLVRIGLKPYDLVWLQGKSAAWRYPSEVEELKPYAPTVEEQPYDRFYKKNAGQVKEEPVQEKVYQKVVVEQKPVVEEQYVKYIPKNTEYVPKKSVFVTMPGQQAAIAVQKPVIVEQKPEPTITVTENPEAAQIKYSQPLDEIKEMYVKTLQERKTKIARKSFVLSSLKKAAVVAGLILLGILAGYLIKSDSGTKNTLASQLVRQPAKVEATLPESTVQQPVIDKPATNTTSGAAVLPDRQNTSPTPENTPMPPAMKERLLQQEKRQYAENRLKQTPPVVTIPETRQTVQEPVRNQEPVVKNIVNDPATGERTRQVRNGSVGNPNTTFSNPPPNSNDTRPISRGRRTGLESLVAVTSNDYKRVAFGGIRNLELTVTNDSRFVLDKVTVELEYVKPNELPLRTETIQFHSISPKGSSTIKIPDTNRGIKVLYKIIDVQSTQSETVSSGF